MSTGVPSESKNITGYKDEPPPGGGKDGGKQGGVESSRGGGGKSTKDSKKEQQKSPDGKWIRTNKKLGSGSFKSVYLAIAIDGKEVAWNVIKLGRMGPKQKAKVRQEVEILKDTEHRNIIEFLDNWETNHRLIFITEKASATLKDRIQALNPVAISTIRIWAEQILNALVYLHTRASPIIHRDLKPDNVFVASDGTIRLGDFGLAVETVKNSTILGSPAYMAPEIWLSNGYDSKVDVYAFGMVCLEMKTNQTPYIENNDLMVDRAKGIKIPPPEALDSKTFHVEPKRMHGKLRKMILSCVCWEAEKRPTATELLDDEFFHPSLFKIDACKVAFPDVNCKEKVHLTLETNVKSSRTTEFSIDQRNENLRDIAKEFAEEFKAEILEEYPDSLGQDIADMVYGVIRKEIRDRQREFEESTKTPREGGGGGGGGGQSNGNSDITRRKSQISSTTAASNTEVAGTTKTTTTTGSQQQQQQQQVQQQPRPTKDQPVPNSTEASSNTAASNLPDEEVKRVLENQSGQQGTSSSDQQLEDFEVLAIKILETAEGGASSSLGPEHVRMNVVLKVKGKTREFSCGFDLGKQSHFRSASDILRQFLDVEKFPKHVEYVELLADKMKAALLHKQEMFNKRRELDTKMGLEDMLNAAGITDQKVMEKIIEQEITVDDLRKGVLTEEDLKEIIPKLGPRRRLIRRAQQEGSLPSGGNKEVVSSENSISVGGGGGPISSNPMPAPSTATSSSSVLIDPQQQQSRMLKSSSHVKKVVSLKSTGAQVVAAAAPTDNGPEYVVAQSNSTAVVSSDTTGGGATEGKQVTRSVVDPHANSSEAIDGHRLQTSRRNTSP
mmetsp:Transcript_21326/g.29839  ORF Transcript_21326/g.29839 Transcript_21326/m.29839 type:complete len:838 (+) Transcript_21326:134-2647(+)